MQSMLAIRAIAGRLLGARLSQFAVWLIAAALLSILLASCAPAPLLSGNGYALSVPATPSPSPAPSPTATVPVPTPNPAPQLPGWRLVWQDEFDGPNLDMTKWTIVSDAPSGFHHCCLNNTLNAWAADDVSIVGGNLRLTTERRDFQGYAYTSGAVTTQGTFDFLYGRLDIGARLPKGDGLWPAFWLLPANMAPGGGWAQYEVDMTEALGETPHTDYMVDWVWTWHQYCAYTGPDFTADYHVYSFIWTAASITWLIDGVQRCEFHYGMPTTRMYLTLNTRIGGSWPVPPDATTVLPQYTDIAYVRLYAPAATRSPPPRIPDSQAHP